MFKCTDKGSLVDSKVVGRLVSLMQPQNFERKIDLTWQSMLTCFIATAVKLEFLSLSS